MRTSHDELLVHVPGEKSVSLCEQHAIANIVLNEPAQRRAIGGHNVLVRSLRYFVGFRSGLCVPCEREQGEGVACVREIVFRGEKMVRSWSVSDLMH